MTSLHRDAVDLFHLNMGLSMLALILAPLLALQEAGCLKRHAMFRGLVFGLCMHRTLLPWKLSIAQNQRIFLFW